MATLGSIEWSNATHGALSTGDKLTMIRHEIQRQVVLQWKRITGRRNMQVSRIDLDTIALPDSPLAVASLKTCEAMAPPSLLFHSLRTYYWGSILARQEGLRLDPELFYVISLLHDIGLCADTTTAHCFAVEGGRMASTLVRQYGTEAQARRIEEAIIAHLNLHIPASEGVEKSILPAATSLDVVGARIREIQPDTVLAVLERYPRLSFKSDLIALFNQEYATRPHSRIAFMQQVANLNRMIERAPFES